MRILFLFISLMISWAAKSSMELRLHYANSVFKAEELNTYLTTSPNNISGPRDQLIAGGDLIYFLGDWPIGLRIDQMSRSKDVSGTLDSTQGTYKLGLSRQLISIFTGYRITNSMTYFGLVAGYGVTDRNELSIDTATYTSTSSQTFWGGIEFGAKNSTFGFGTELGYISSRASNFTSSAGATFNNTTGAALTLDTTGPYIKFVLTVPIL